MSANFFGMSPNSNTGLNIGYDGQNASGMANHNNRAILFVFRPYANQFGDVAVRPFQYQFDGNFQALTQEITDTSKNGVASNGALMEEFQRRTNFSDYVIPSFQPSMEFQSSRLSDKYRFILMLTDSALGLSNGHTMGSSLSNNMVRRIYTGYFQDEPFNPATLTSSSRSLNPQSYMIFTHKTVIGSSMTSGAFGMQQRLDTRTSEEIINSEVMHSYMGRDVSRKDDHIYLMTPENCVNTIDVTSDGYAMAIPGAHSDITRDRGQHSLADTLEQPTHNVAQIVRGMMMYKDDVTTKGRGMTGKMDAYFSDEFMEDAAARSNMGRWMSIPQSRPLSEFDLDLNTPYSAESINNLVRGDLAVQDFDLERPTFYETADQRQADMTNQYSWLISAVMAPMLNNFGLNAMSFIYEIKKSRGQVMEQFNTVDAEATWNGIPTEELLSLTKAVEMELVKGILRTIFTSKGDFRVEVAANATGMTIVRLDLIEQGCRSFADFEIPSCLGGLISPLLGTTTDQHSNAEQITGLYGAVAGLGTGIGGFNENDMDFMHMAENTFKRLDGDTTNGILDD